MAKHNRHLRGASGEIIVDINGNGVVDAGDLMFKDSTAGVRGAASTASEYAFPLESATSINDASTALLVMYNIHNNFIGVAMESSPTGVTEKISVATQGVFKFPMPANSGITVGTRVSMVSPAASVVNSTQVAGESSTGAGTAYVGYVTKSAASPVAYVEFELRTKYNKGLAT